MKTAIAVLAAGLSARYGRGNKLLHRWYGKPLLRHTLDNACNSRAAQIILITGYQADELDAALPEPTDTHPPVLPVHNPNFAAGIGSSIAVAGRWVMNHRPDHAMLILPADMPLVPGTFIDRVIDAVADPRHPDRLVVPQYQDPGGNRSGHPVGFGPHWLAQLAALEGDTGARRIWQKHTNEVCHIAVENPRMLTDFDTLSSLTETPETFD